MTGKHTDILSHRDNKNCCSYMFRGLFYSVYRFGSPLGFEGCVETHPLTRKRIDLNAVGGASERDAVRMQRSEKEESNGPLLAIWS